MQSYLISDWPRMGPPETKAMFQLESWVPMDMLLLNILQQVIEILIPFRF